MAGIGPILRLLGKLDRRDAFIAVFLAVQIALPLHYYMGYSDPYDERFAWRMFSPTRMLTCEPTFRVGGQPVKLHGQFHEAWIELAKRGRLEVLEAIAQRLCRTTPGAEVVLDLKCKTVDGREERWGGSDLCQFPEL